MMTQAASEPTKEGIETPVPVIWLMGKAQAGKTSIAAHLTGLGEDGVGLGFKRTTRESRLHPWPPPPMRPFFQFLDTPGIGAEGADNEAEAKAAIAQAEEQAHVLIVAVRSEDADTGGMLNALRAIRQRHPKWPIVVAQTRLHDLYEPGAGHILPYPFHGDARDDVLLGIPAELRRALAVQRQAFSGLPGGAPVFVPIDLTRGVQNLAPHSYGADRLLDVLGTLLPGVNVPIIPREDLLDGARLKIILPYAIAAGASEAPPFPFLGLFGATTAQGLMLGAIAARCGLDWNTELAWRFVAVLGPGIALSFGGTSLIRQFVKLVPIAGTAAAAATSFAATWAAGEAAMIFFLQLSCGHEPDAEAVQQAWYGGFKEAKAWWELNRKASGRGLDVSYAPGGDSSSAAR
jgi:uncharacterized protein (DUF697 family)